jgi:hypothetical protein
VARRKAEALTDFWRSDVPTSAGSRALTLEMLQEAADALVESFGYRPQPTLLMSQQTLDAAGRLGQREYDERMEAMARQAAHHFFGAIAVPTPENRAAANWLLGGPWPPRRKTEWIEQP